MDEDKQETQIRQGVINFLHEQSADLPKELKPVPNWLERLQKVVNNWR